MRILIDGLVFENNYQIGVWRVFYEIMRRTSDDVQYTLLLSRKPEQMVPKGIEIADAWHRRNYAKNQLSRRAARKLRNLFPRRSLANAIWHSSFFTLDPREDEPNVVSVYDMIAEKYFHVGGDWCEQQREQKALALAQADEIVSISKSTSDELGKFFPALNKPITIIPMGFEHIEAQRRPESGILQSSFGLFVGSRDAYKNFLTVLEAVASRNWPRGMTLRIVGSPFSMLEKGLVEYFGVKDRIEHLGRLTDVELANQYENAACFIFPSLAEGFGIPILESQARGCVPILSDTSVFREVAGEGALFFDPYDSDSLCEVVRQSADLACRDRVLEASKANLSRFTWDRAAEKMVETYSRVAKR